MLDKLKLNNNITALRNDVQKAKVQVIQKLIRRVRELQKDCGKNEDSATNESKVNKLKEEISILKKLHFRDIVKNALLLQRSPKVILSDGKAKTEDVVVARMFEHKALFKKLSTLKDIFGLSEEENIKGLRSMGLSKTQKMKRKAKLKADKAQKIDKMEWIEEDIETQETENTDEIQGAVAEKMSVVGKTQKLKNQTNDGPKVEKKQKPKSTPKFKKIEFSSESEDDGEEEVEKTADSFFITTSGDNYFASIAKNIPEDDHKYKRPYEEDDDYEVEIRINQQDRQQNERETHEFNRNHTFYRSNRENVEQRPFKQNRLNEQPKQKSEKDLHPSWKAKQQQRLVRPFQGKKIQFDDVTENKKDTSNDIDKELHPSWAAKLKTKPVISEFVGKKIRFDDD